MNLLNIAKHLLHLTQTEYGSENSATTTDEIFVAERLFQVLKSFTDSYFSELYTYDTLEFEDEYDEMADAEESNDDMTNEEDTDDEMDDYDETDHSDLKNRFTLEEMENIIEWVDEHPNARFVTISNRFRKIKSMNYITKFREYIENDGTRLEKLKQIKAFMFDEFYLKRTIKKEALHDTDLELYAIQKARELNWDTFKSATKFNYTTKNVVVRASKSGKSSDEKHHAFLNEVLRPLVGKKFLLFLDAWTIQTDLTKFRAVFPNQDSQLLIFPEGSTGYIQPQDLSLFRSWRFIHEKIEHYTHINRTEITLSDRQYFINMHSVIHNQLSAPQFKNLIKNGFIQARITNETNGHIEKPKDVFFKFYDLYCSVNNSNERTLLMCAC
ncbi:unnamed protein product [Rotaria sordida]|uniref:DDE-1 domain-containing protein n=1 Tax=Rotaria sordida TaxID=392033 RepID=A0A814Y6B4_9BILA|nr:unnamed protein product [Rotaria sordida]CAF1225057.1 unnamed protein product [Rotaria sordida]